MLRSVNLPKKCCTFNLKIPTSPPLYCLFNCPPWPKMCSWIHFTPHHNTFIQEEEDLNKFRPVDPTLDPRKVRCALAPFLPHHNTGKLCKEGHSIKAESTLEEKPEINPTEEGKEIKTIQRPYFNGSYNELMQIKMKVKKERLAEVKADFADSMGKLND
jgi:hypothetical protein